MRNETETHKDIFSLQDVSFVINNQEILSDINVIITHKHITGIIGPSGSGKSTFLRLLNNLISPTTGSIFFQKENIAEMPSTELRKRVGMVQQQPFLFDGTVRSNLLYGPNLWGIYYQDEDLLNLLDKVALDHDFLERNIDGLSGGEQQRVSLARSLANKPSVLLLDEPTGSLDIVSEEIIENTLKQLSAEGIKIIIVTHSLEQTKRMTDQLLFIKDGRLVGDTHTKDFFEQFSDKEIRLFFKEKGAT
ncbi:MAG: ABC transporter ATP-binding protein [Candidatus Heimdallarchaeota archaeon]